MFQNILGNAIKFTRKGKIIISAKVVKTGAAQDKLELQVTVADEGIGMSEEEVNNVFSGKLDTRNIESKRLNPYGNGIGLSFCKEICQILEGDIQVKSVLSEGSKFTFSMRVMPVYTPHSEKSEDYPDSGATGSQV